MNKKGTSLIAKSLFGILLFFSFIGGVNNFYVMIGSSGLLTKLFPFLIPIIKPIYGVCGLSMVIVSIVLAIKLFRE
jgi:hypothetical protein